MRTLGILLLTFLLVLAFNMHQAQAAEAYKVGFKTLGFWIPARAMRIDINVWYPGTRNERTLNYPPWTIFAARDCKVHSGKFPLLILSHTSPATRFSLHDTGRALAAQGFIVAAPTHAHDCLDNMQDLFTWDQLNNRVLELKMTIDLVLSEKNLNEHIEDDAIGIIGIGAGGAASLLLGGASPNCVAWADYCTNAAKNDIYCNPWSREKINGICTFLPLKKTLTDKRIKSIVAVAPSFGMLFNSTSFEKFLPNILIIAAENDQLNPRDLHIDPIVSYLRGKARLVIIPDADVGAFLAPCPQSLEHELPDLCRSVNLKERHTIHKRFWDALITFFSTEFKDEIDMNQINLDE